MFVFMAVSFISVKTIPFQEILISKELSANLQTHFYANSNDCKNGLLILFGQDNLILPLPGYATFGENTKYKWLNINRRAKIMKKDNILHTIKKLNKEEANKRMRPVNKYELMLHINICLFFLSSREL